MKTFKKLFIIFLSMCFIIGLVACNKNDKPEDQSKTDATVYTIQCDESEYYTFGGTVSATSGTNAVVELTSKYPAFEITGCTYNGQECTKTSENGAEVQKYSFTMPQSNVDIKVLYRWNNMAQAGKDNFLSFDSRNNYITTSAAGDASYNNDYNWGNPLILEFHANAGFMAQANITCISSNTEVMPNEAINVIQTTENTSNKIIGGKIIIDRSKLNVGTAQVVLRVLSGNNSSYDAIIVATITVE